MRISEYLQILSKRWWIIVAAVVLTAGSAYVFSELQTPVYQSTAEVLIEPARPDWGLTQTVGMLLRTYMTQADSNSWAQDVIDRLSLSTTPEKLRSDVNFAAATDRMLITIEVENSNGDVANDIARTWATLLIEWRDQQNKDQNKEDRVYAALRDTPRYGLSWPKTKIVTAVGGILGLAIAAVAIFFLEWVESGIIRNPEDLERQFGLTVVGAIPPTD